MDEGIQLICDYLDDAVTMLQAKNSITVTRTLCKALEEKGISIEHFQKMKLVHPEDILTTLSEEEINDVKYIRECFETYNENTVWKKIIGGDAVENYLNGKFDPTVRGYISKAKYSENIMMYDDMVRSFRLDYTVDGVRPYPDGGNTYYYIKFKTAKIGAVEVPYGSEYGGTNTDVWPNTHNGFLSSENGKVLPEWKCIDDVPIKKGAEIHKVVDKADKSGVVDEIVAIFDGKEWK